VSYQVKWRDDLGHQASKVFKTKRAAIDFQAMVTTNKNRGTSLDHRGGRLEFSSYVAQWKTTKTSQRPTTQRRRDGILSKHVLPHLGAKAISSIKSTDIQRLVSQWEAAGLSPRTVTHHIRIISPIFDMAVKDNLITRNPCEHVSLPKVRKVPIRVLTPDECRRLIDATPLHYRSLISFTLATGVRWDELANLTIGCLNVALKQVSIKHSKTDAGVRTLPLDEADIAEVLGHVHDTRRGLSMTETPLFVTEDGSPVNYANFRQRVFCKAVKRAGLEGVTFHSLRRTHATMLVAEGLDLKVIQYRMGHESIQTTLALYAAPLEANLRKSAGVSSRYLAS
jgi:integrase